MVHLLVSNGCYLLQTNAMKETIFNIFIFHKDIHREAVYTGLVERQNHVQHVLDLIISVAPLIQMITEYENVRLIDLRW